MYAMSAMTCKEEILSNYPNIARLFVTLKVFMIFSSAVFTLIIIFINKYLRDIRKKELGVYMVLGFSQNMLTVILMVENFILMIAALLIGSVLGMGLCEVLSALCVKFYHGDYMVTLGISKDAVFQIMVFMVIIYGIVGYMNIDIYSKGEICDLLNGEKKNQKIFSEDNLPPSYMGIISIAILLVSYFFMYIYIFMSQADKYLILSIVLFVIGVYLFYFVISGLMVRWKDKYDDIYYRGINLFSFNQFIRKINDNTFFMGTSGLLLFLTIMFATLGSDAASSMRINRYKDERVAFDIMVSHDVDSLDFKDIEIIIKNSDAGIKDVEEVKIYTDEKNYGGYYMRLSDYNSLISMSGLDPVTLREDEFLIHSNFETEKGRAVGNLGSGTISFGGHRLEGIISPYVEARIDDRLNPVLYRDRENLFIIPDRLLEDKNIVSSVLLLNTVNKPDHELNEEIDRYYSDADIFYNMNIKALRVAEWQRAEATLYFIGFYLAIIILICTITFLSIQLISDFKCYKRNVNILQKLGAPKEEINKSLKIQIGMYFVFPLILAVMSNMVIDGFFIFGYINGNDIERLKAIFMNIGIVALVIGGIYFGYGVVTYRLIKKHIYG